MLPTSDAKLTRKLFWIVAFLGCLIIVLGHVIEYLGRFSPLETGVMKFGTYGIYLVQIPPKEALNGRNSVILLGNSVYQYSGVTLEMQKIADKSNSNIQFVNLAQVSSSIYDYLIQSAKAVNAHPDLVVININQVTYNQKPKFKTDAEQIAFDRDIRKVLPLSFYLRHFTYQSALSSMISSLMPLKRVDSIVRWEFKLRDKLPAWFFSWVSYPFLNTAMELAEANPSRNTIQRTDLPSMELAEIIAAQKELLNIYQKHRIPLLFINQETSGGFDPAVLEAIKELISNDGNAILVDYQSYWNEDQFLDFIHPLDRDIEPYAQRHFRAVINAMDFFAIQRGAAP